MSREARETVADWLMLAGAVVLVASLFLAWSHQLSPGFRARWAGLGALRGVSRDPTAWQVYSTADVALALLAAGLGYVAFAGPRPARWLALAAAGLATAFVAHAVSTPPTNGVNLVTAPGGLAGPADHATAAFGETLALAGLGTALTGLLLSFTAD